MKLSSRQLDNKESGVKGEIMAKDTPLGIFNIWIIYKAMRLDEIP